MLAFRRCVPEAVGQGSDMSEFAEIAGKFLIPGACAAAGALGAALLSPGSRSGPVTDTRPWLSVAGGATLAVGLAAGVLLAAGAVFGARPAPFSPQIDAEWYVWNVVVAVALGVVMLALARRASTAGPRGAVVVWCGAVLVAVLLGLLQLQLGLKSAAQTQFAAEPVPADGQTVAAWRMALARSWWLEAAACVLALVPCAALLVPAGKARAPGARREGRWDRRLDQGVLAVIGAAMAGALPALFYARSIKVFEIGAASALMTAIVLLGALVRPRRGAEWILGGFVLSILLGSVVGTHYYASLPAVPGALMLLAPGAGACALLLLRSRRPLVGVVAGVIATLVLMAVAAALTRRANHHPDDLYGVAPGGTTYALASCTN